MSDILTLLSLIQDIAAIPVMGLLSVIIFVLIRQTNKKVDGVANNHMSELNASLTRIETRLGSIADHILWIRARLDK